MRLGEYNKLTILRFTSVGAYLGDEEENDVLLPNKYLTEDMMLDDEVEVFLYRDSEDRLVATTEKPYIILNQFAYLKVKEVTPFGAFLDWGLEKDLLVPFREQAHKLEEGKYYLIYLMLDTATDRLVATSKTNKVFSKDVEGIHLNEEVSILIGDQTDLGVKVVVENKYQGLIYKNDIVDRLFRGETMVGYVFNIREDGKLDVRLTKSGGAKIEPNTKKVMDLLEKNDGKLNLSDKSKPEEINALLGMSKKTFKQVIGGLYKNRVIKINDDSIELL